MVDADAVPRPGSDYPGTWQEFDSWFVDDQACVEFLERVRWPRGFRCPICDEASAWRIAGGRWMCRACGRKTSVTAGTIFHRSRLPLRTWFAAMWFICAQKTGLSALGLQQVLGFGSYQTAWAWMHKLCRAMVRPDRELLGGPGIEVEVDLTFVGGRTRGRSGPRYFNKGEVVIAVERRRPKGLGRVRLAAVDRSRRKDDILFFAQANIAPGTTLLTDGDQLYVDFAERLGVLHLPVVLYRADEMPDKLLPGVHRVAQLLKKWLGGTLHDGQSIAHLGYYLDEFTFRFNRRTSKRRGLLWYPAYPAGGHDRTAPISRADRGTGLINILWVLHLSRYPIHMFR